MADHIYVTGLKNDTPQLQYFKLFTHNSFFIGSRRRNSGISGLKFIQKDHGIGEKNTRFRNLAILILILVVEIMTFENPMIWIAHAIKLKALDEIESYLIS